MSITTQKIKNNISEAEFKKLVSHLKGDENIRANRKERLLSIFHILYFTGMRINEVSQMTNNMLHELIETKKLIVKTHKTKNERVLYITDNGQKVLKKVFGHIDANNQLVIRSERGNKNNALESPSLIRDANTYIKKVFGEESRITSHSFRQTLITELAMSGVNTKIIQSLIGHKSISSTYRYIKPSEMDIINCLHGVR
ncbi:MAG: site-specific integrase [Sulfuricurvum sp.]|nr:site-specific integrase [Sulfuricurvum sp.]